MSAPASAICSASSALKAYGVVSIPRLCAVRIISTSGPYPISVSSRFCRKIPSINPTVGKFCTPENPVKSTFFKKSSIIRNGSVPQTPAKTGVSFTTGSTSLAISMTIWLASPYGIIPASDPRPAMRKRPEL